MTEDEARRIWIGTLCSIPKNVLRPVSDRPPIERAMVEEAYLIVYPYITDPFITGDTDD